MQAVFKVAPALATGFIMVYSFISDQNSLMPSKLSYAVYTFMSASGSYTFPHMLPEVTPERCTFYNGAEAV